jgi:hypothetical protein
MMEKMHGGATAYHVLVSRTHLKDLRRSEQELLGEVEQQRAVVGRAERELDRAIIALIETSKEVQVIEKHRQHWREQMQREQERGEQKLNNEIGAIMYGRRAAE